MHRPASTVATAQAVTFCCATARPNRSASLVFNKGRFYSLTRNAPAIVETSGRLETDLLGRATLVVEEGQVHGLGPQDALDDELMFNLFYGAHKGARISLEQVGACLYGVETRQVYCADDHPNRG